MLHSIFVWLGFSQPKGGDAHDHAKGHGHTHGVIDSTIATTTEGIRAIKWSFAILGVTAVLQLAVVYSSRSVALLVCAVTRRRFSSGCKPHPARSLRPEAIGAVREVTNWLEPLM